MGSASGIGAKTATRQRAPLTKTRRTRSASSFTLVDKDADGQFDFDDFENYCSIYGETVVNQTLRLFDTMFDGVLEETGISIPSTDVKNSKPHIDWQDQNIRMGSIFCCGSQPPVFTKAPPSI